MKNFLLCLTVAIFVCFFSFSELGAALPCENSNTIQQNSNWEYLGDIKAVTNQNNEIRLTGQLFVRIIGGKEFYQVRVKNKFGNEIKACKVSLGSFKCWGKEYNAKFSADIDYYPGTYYFNI